MSEVAVTDRSSRLVYRFPAPEVTLSSAGAGAGQRGRVEILDGDETSLSKGHQFNRKTATQHLASVCCSPPEPQWCGCHHRSHLAVPGHSRAEPRLDRLRRGLREVQHRADAARRQGPLPKALRGEIQNFTGISDPYEEPLSPEVVVDTGGIVESLKIVACLGKLPPAGARCGRGS
jgi:hypothetical protein